MTDDEGPLLSPGEAMGRAVAAAKVGDSEVGRLWLGIARELRLGSVPPASPVPIPRPLDREPRSESVLITLPADHTVRMGKADVAEPSGASGNDDELGGEDVCRNCGAEIVWVSGAVWKHRAAGKVACARIPLPDETAIVRFGEHDPTRCGNCGHGVGLVFPDDGSEPAWRHLGTNQRVCPESSPERGHTFAVPAVDPRG